jgi:hypothetical protein
VCGGRACSEVTLEAMILLILSSRQRVMPNVFQGYPLHVTAVSGTDGRYPEKFICVWNDPLSCCECLGF